MREMRVSYVIGNERLRGELVQCVNVASNPAPGPIGERAPPDPPPNIWAVVVNDTSGAFHALPLHRIRVSS